MLKFNNLSERVKYTHQPLSIDHYGIHAKIQENGRVILTGPGVENNGDMEYDEIEVPASLIFKLANLLRDTRSVEIVDKKTNDK